MRSRSVLLAALSLLVAGCNAGLKISAPDLPADVVWVAALFEASDGSPVQSTGLAAPSAEGAIFFDAPLDLGRVDRVLLAGFTDAQLRKAAPPGPADLASSAVRRAGPNDPLLPIPSWEGRGARAGDAARVVGSTLGLELSASWVAPCQNPLAGVGQVDTDATCYPAACRARVEISGCSVVLHTDECELGGQISLEIGGRGDLKIESPASLGQCNGLAPIDGAAISFECPNAFQGTCRLNLYPHQLPPRFKIARRTLVSPDPSARLGQEIPLPIVGYISALVSLADRIVVATTEVFERYDQSCPASGAPTQLWVIDAATLETITTATAPPCLLAMAPAPDLHGFFAAYGTDSLSVGRFDASARRTGETSLAGLPIDSHVASALVIAGTPAILALATLGPIGFEAPSWIVTIDPQTMSIVAAAHVPSERGASSVTALAAVGPDSIALIEDTDDRVIQMALTATTVDLRQSFQLSARRGTDPLALHHATVDPVTSQMIISCSRASFIFTVDPSNHQVRSSVDFVGLGDPYASAVWPADPGRLLIGMTAKDGDRLASLRLFDPKLPHLLGGEQTIGFGQVGAMVTDRAGHAGRVWVTLPLTGELLRVEPL